MSGILLFCRPGMGGAPIALPCISERVADLTGDAEVDEAVLHDLAQLNPFLGSADVSPEIFAHLHPNVGPNSAAAGGDIALIVPYMRAVEQGMIMEGSPVGS